MPTEILGCFVLYPSTNKRSNVSSRMSRANDSAYDSAFTDSEAGTLSDIMSDFDLAASINGAVSLNGIDELRELKEGFHRDLWTRCSSVR